MSNNKPKYHSNKQNSGVTKLRNQVQQLQEDGYVAMPMREILGDRADSSQPGWEDVLNLVIHGDSKNTAAKGTEGVFASVGNEQTITTAGTPGKGWMEWGSGNRLPNTIALLTSLLPYTAAGVKFNTDTAAGLGPKPKYRYSTFVNGTINPEKVDYAAAGQLIEGQLIELRQRLGKHYAECREKGIDIAKKLSSPKMEKKDASTKTSTPRSAARAHDDESYLQYAASAGNNTAPATESQPTGKPAADGKPAVTDAEIHVNQQIEQRLLKQIADAESSYEVWERTNTAITAFKERNNLDLINLQLFGDMCHMGICFPEIQLSQEGLQKDTRQWTPQVTSIGYRSALTCRLERMDEENRIRFVYVSNQWIDSPFVQKSEDYKIAAIPALDPQHPLASLQKRVRSTRMKSQKKGESVPVAKRPTRFILPSSYPSMGRPYYPQPSWWSIFGGDIYSYASTIISDRATRKKNANSFGRIVYIHLGYLEKLYFLEGAKTTDERNAVRSKVWNEINEFLKNSDNNGQSLLSFTFIGNDGKEHDAYRIVEVPYNSKSTADANKTELEELGSIVFFALEIHPDLIGAVPGRSGSSGGTYQREMYLLKQLMMSSTQSIILKLYETISNFNEWDEHLAWEIGQMTLTTLDRNKNGMEETKV